MTHPDRYEAEVNYSYRELASHYNTCVMPTRVRKPRDKGKVEAAVLVANVGFWPPYDIADSIIWMSSMQPSANCSPSSTTG